MNKRNCVITNLLIIICFGAHFPICTQELGINGNSYTVSIHGKVWGTDKTPLSKAHIIVTDSEIENLYGEAVAISRLGPDNGSYQVLGLPSENELTVFVFHQNWPELLGRKEIQLYTNESRELDLYFSNIRDLSFGAYQGVSGQPGIGGLVGFLSRMTELLRQSKNHFSAMYIIDNLKKLSTLLSVTENQQIDTISSEITETESSSHIINTYNNMEFVFIDGGTFQMGDIWGEGFDDEKPIHTVTVSDFSIGRYEVTFEQYDSFCESTGSGKPDDEGWGRGNRPVINISWNDAMAFCDWMSMMTGEEIRLPTEAEWEFAARERGRKVRFGNGQDIANPSEMNFDARARYKKRYSRSGGCSEKTMPVGNFAPNALGLYDIAGNAWEWCIDWYDEMYYERSPNRDPRGPSSGQYHILRGGSWFCEPEYLRCTNRFGDDRISLLDTSGFRCVRIY